MKISIKEKTGMISKSIVFQIAMSLFGMMLSASVIAINEKFLLVAGIFSFLFYFALIGAAVNEDGVKDYLKIKAGRAKQDIFLGLKYAAVSYIPTFAITLIYIILRIFSIENALTQILSILIRLLSCGMYLSFDRYLFASGDSFLPFSLNGYSFLIYEVASVLIIGIFYFIGVKGINLLSTKSDKVK